MNEQTWADRKVLRRKVQQKITTVAKKLVDLIDYNCDALLIIKNKDTQHWTVYSNIPPELIFFGFQNAKQHLETVEEVTRKALQLNLNGSSERMDESASQPVKVLKTKESDEFQTILSAGSQKLEGKMGMSSVSTDFNSVLDQSSFSCQSGKKPPDGEHSFIFEGHKRQVEEKSSPDFDFESYFAGNS